MDQRTVTMTPEWAAELLTRNHNNRKLRKGFVQYLADVIKRGEWQLHGQNIQIDTNGNLLDGQHRLSAIISAGIPVQLGLSTGVDRKAIYAIDRGGMRVDADLLALHGEKETSFKSAVCRLYATYRELEGRGNSPFTRLTTRAISTQQLIDWCVENSDLLNDAVKHAREGNIGLQKSVLGAFLVMADDYGLYDKAAKFVVQVQKGEMITYKDPAYAFRNSVIKSKGSKDNYMSQATVCLNCLIDAFNDHLRGKSIKKDFIYTVPRDGACISSIGRW